ncbi:hypothetical protein KEH51_02125 [[Brevibacterium] frigoritolerans]|uniref:VOC domain-containing protein n=1 Tax=Peribacillus frigoritolerans TaxID=450367 RepID=A0A941J1Z1_9BACI|nr:hypothetical protein [Peribacillus frigoritolerans]
MSKGFLHYIELYVSNSKRSIDFWGWFLDEMGDEPFQEWESGRSWRLGEMYIVLVQAETRFLDIPYHRGRVGLNHLAFHAASRQQVDEVARKVKGIVTTIYADKHPFAGGKDHYFLYYEDPDRMKVEFVAP